MPDKRFHFDNLALATRHHIAKRLSQAGWVFTKDPHSADFSDRNLVLNDRVVEHLEFKDLLALLTQSISPSIHPLTYTLDEDNRDEVLASIFMQHYLNEGSYHSTQPDVYWIVKPALINNGNAIFIFSDFEKLRRFFIGSERLGGPYVIQRYIHTPDLFNGYKYTYRMTVVATNFAGIFLYKDGYINCSGYKYDKNSDEKEVHLTNYFLEGTIPKVTQYFTGTIPEFDRVFSQMQFIVRSVFLTLLQKHSCFLWPHKTRAFELFGIDFMLDANKKLWLLEINQGPDFPVEEDHPLAEMLWDPFWQGIVDDFVVAVNKGKRITNHSFVPVLSYTQTLPLLSRFA